ncbi:GNAT family N-acetyltransferase [Deinococcus sp. JMULE3]|uniref:GNAT family N-acetyltransferase n=1 Tax=Deinococcus sp. JMULE3 TaxID=2518341 RepID=UPI00157584CA|nr:GNAT family N-acetyltransferase [Deinococcus sp. JMULE3]NTY02217.1 GNAT family N-acetyltransferase [Deinococcus sp. JMULE3]
MTEPRDLRPIPPAQAHLALPALRALRPVSPHTASPDALRAFLTTTGPEGYALVGAFEPRREEAVAVAGYRVMHLLWAGRTLYVDDLSTLPEYRGRGHARALLHWLEGRARELACAELHLDSGVGETRHAAHRLYHRAGMNVTAHHFSLPLSRGMA